MLLDTSPVVMFTLWTLVHATETYVPCGRSVTAAAGLFRLHAVADPEGGPRGHGPPKLKTFHRDQEQGPVL